MTPPPRPAPAPQRWEKIVAVVFGTAFIVIMLGIAVFVPNPTEFQIFVFRTVLAVAAAGIGAVLPGFLTVNVSNFLRAGGAFGLFVMVYWFNPPKLVTDATPFDELQRRGEAALASENHSAALTFFQRAAEMRPDDWSPHYGMGRAEFASGDYASALSDFTRAFDLTQKKDGSIEYAVALTQDALGRYQDAQASLISAGRLLPLASPLGTDVLYDRGLMSLILWQKQDAPKDSPTYRDAELDLQKFVEGPGSPKHWAYYHLGCLKSSRAQDPTLGEAEISSLRKDANRMLERVARDLQNFGSTKASFQRDLLKKLLTNPNAYTRRAGDPVACPELVSAWTAEHGRVEELLAKLN